MAHQSEIPEINIKTTKLVMNCYKIWSKMTKNKAQLKEYKSTIIQNLKLRREKETKIWLISPPQKLQILMFSVITTRCGRTIQKTWICGFETNPAATTYHKYYQILTSDEDQVKEIEFATVRAAICSCFYHTSEVIPIKFKDVIARLDWDKWMKSV